MHSETLVIIGFFALLIIIPVLLIVMCKSDEERESRGFEVRRLKLELENNNTILENNRVLLAIAQAEVEKNRILLAAGQIDERRKMGREGGEVLV